MTESEMEAAFWCDLNIVGIACFRRLPDGTIAHVDPTTVRLVSKSFVLAKQETTEGTDPVPDQRISLALLQRRYPGLPVIIKGVACPACNHLCHPHACTVRLPWWRRLFSGLEFCCCTYWDARWGNIAVEARE